ncbi:MAG: adenine-specific methyltransferase EcoRI family protein [Prevotella sp.]|nr:adenine-specific methyltransferase EcoRI family protein [Prevotella sp.]
MLSAAKKNKKDEFYTQLPDVENELRHYSEHFKGKTIICNCDDPWVSNFSVYFTLKFHQLGLKRLIMTCYKNTEMDLYSMNKCTHSVYCVYDGNPVINDVADMKTLPVLPLKGDGDFRSHECIELLKQADIVVTNPPFSLFRDYMAQLMKYDKKFVIIGNQNAITYKEIFPLLKDNLIWLGYGFKGGVGHFFSKYEDTATAGNHKPGMIRVSGVVWFTNLEIPKRNEELILFKRYTPEEYPRFDNYDAIFVGKTSDIPCDYDGVMGVPITFMDKYNPNQFELIGMDYYVKEGLLPNLAIKEWNGKLDRGYINGERKYSRIFIRRKK